MREEPKKSTYPFEDEVLRRVALHCCTDPRFHAQIGHAVDPERLASPEARMLVAAAHTVAKKAGAGPEWHGTVLQHLATLSDAGKVTHAQLEACRDYLVDAAADDRVSSEELCSVVVPIVQRAAYKDVVVTALDAYKSNTPAEDVAAAFQRVSTLGLARQTVAHDFEDVVMAPDFFCASTVVGLQLGIPEIDQALGTIESESLTLLVGGSGSGKSMALAHVTAHNMLLGRDAFFVTLELSVSRTSKRISRNLTDMGRREQEADPAIVRARLQALFDAGMGRVKVAYCEPQATSPKMIEELLDETMRSNPGWEPRLFVTDFLDKVRSNPKAGAYEDMLAVTDQLRQIAVDHDGWQVTASQSDRKSTGRPWLDLDAVADSMNKIRSADLVIGIGRTEDDQAQGLVRYSIPKRREGEGAHQHVGPLPWDPERGRIVAVTDRVYPW